MTRPNITNVPPGFGVEDHEVDAVLAALIGDRDPGEDAVSWYQHITSRQALLLECVTRLGALRGVVAVELYNELGARASLAKLAEVLGCSRSLAQQLVATGRAARTAEKDAR